MSDEDKRKLSWREIDALKNKSRHVADVPKGERSRKDTLEKRGESLAKKALEALFEPKKSKEQEAAWGNVAASRGKKFEEVSAHYVDQFGMPKEWDDLLLLLDHENPEFLRRVLEQIERLAEQETKSRWDLCLGKLRVLKLTHEDPRVLSELERLAAFLSSKVDGVKS